MATLITQASNPDLWTTLEACRVGSAWIYYSQRHYRPVQLSDGSWAFNQFTELELIDDRSLSLTKKASYRKLDEP